jgi:hypothetical protein
MPKRIAQSLHSNVTFRQAMGPLNVNNVALDALFLIDNFFSHCVHSDTGGERNLAHCMSLFVCSKDMKDGQLFSRILVYKVTSAVNILLWIVDEERLLKTSRINTERNGTLSMTRVRLRGTC